MYIAHLEPQDHSWSDALKLNGMARVSGRYGLVGMHPAHFLRRQVRSEPAAAAAVRSLHPCPGM